MQGRPETVTNQDVTRYCRYIDSGGTHYGILQGDTIQQLDGAYVRGGKPTGTTVKLADVELTLPIDRAHVRKVIGVHYNYEGTGEAPHNKKHPSFFPKFHTSLVTDGAEVELPAECEDPHMGGTVVAVIGKQGRNIAREDAASHVFGIAVGNDITDGKGYGRGGGLFSVDRMIGKAIDTWGPIGTTVVAGADWHDLQITGKLNGVVAQEGRTSQAINGLENLIYYLSHYITLEPGDLIFTGSPPIKKGLRTIKPGDVMEVEVEGLGTLTNRCVPLKGIDNPWWEQVFREAAALPENAKDVAAAAGPMEQ